ncbi:MAG: radical SAM protein [Theionarchaea archaeon]|nr:radical SAM protein [Theionarchaea archaeon]MBU7037331.1 radical SAM protein [Theionarchaea archaeon]
MPYLRIIKTSVIRTIPLGVYLCVPHGFASEAYYPVMEVDESIKEVLTLCDGTRTREDILSHLAAETGESVEEVAEGFDQFVEYMVQEGVLEWREEPSPLEPLYLKNRPLGIIMEITSDCNLQCPMCYADSGTGHSCDLALDDVTAIVEASKKMRSTSLVITGGEPLLRKDLVIYMLKELSPVETVDVALFTNGTLVTSEYARDLYDAGLRHAIVSVDGHTAELNDKIRGHGAFEKTIQGIHYLRERGIQVNVVTTISQTNYPYMKEIREFTSQIGDGSGLIPVSPFGRAAPEILLTPEGVFSVMMANLPPGELEISIPPRDRCNVGQSVYIRANGDVFPCVNMQIPEFRMGNIREEDFWEMYQSDLVRNLLQLTVKDFEQCRDCDIRYYCGGSCRGFAYKLNGSLYLPDPWNCGANKKLTEEILKNGGETTKKGLRELLKSTKELL